MKRDLLNVKRNPNRGTSVDIPNKKGDDSHPASHRGHGESSPAAAITIPHRHVSKISLFKHQLDPPAKVDPEQVIT
jgi:hypothetical protein